MIIKLTQLSNTCHIISYITVLEALQFQRLNSRSINGQRLSMYLAGHGGTQLSRDGLKQLKFNIRIQIDHFTIATTISTSNTHTPSRYTNKGQYTHVEKYGLKNSYRIVILSPLPLFSCYTYTRRCFGFGVLITVRRFSQQQSTVNPFAARPKKIQYHRKQWKTANTAGNIISYTTVISIAYLALLDLSGTLGIIIDFLRRNYPACKAAKGLIKVYPQLEAQLSGHLNVEVAANLIHILLIIVYQTQTVSTLQSALTMLDHYSKKWHIEASRKLHCIPSFFNLDERSVTNGKHVVLNAQYMYVAQ